MPSTVVGHFHLRLNAENALHELERAGFARGAISLMGSGDSGGEAQMAQKLMEMHVPDDTAREYSRSPETSVLVVQTGDPEAARRALAVLQGTAALNSLHRAVSEDAGETEEPGIQAAHLRNGTPSATACAPVFEGDESEEPAVALDSFEAEWRNSFEVTYRDSGYRYEQLWPAYRYGAEMAANPRFGQRMWHEVERVIRRDWDQRNPQTWEQARKAIRYAWHSVRARLDMAEAQKPA